MTPIQILPLEKPVRKTVCIPGSKSITNRALILAALSRHRVVIRHPLWCDDTEAMIGCLQTLGGEISKTQDTLVVDGDIFDIEEKNYELNARLSGTTIRFITALSSITSGTKYISGVGHLNERPIKDLVQGLRQIGTVISYATKKDFPPIIVGPAHIAKKIVRMKGSVSSQYISALLMIAPVIGGLTIDIEGNQISKSYIDITIEMMKEWGVDIQNNEYRSYVVPAGEYSLNDYVVEGDYSGAGYFAGVAALTGSTITMENLASSSKQGDKKFLEIIADMGNKVTYHGDSVTVEGHGVRPREVDMEDCPDQAQTLAVLAAFADGATKLTGVRSLRVKETERVKAVQSELEKMGIRTDSPDEDTLIIYGGMPHGADIDTYGDHRMAMSFAVAGTKIPGITIYHPEVVNKTFPEFWRKLETIGITLH